ncbi:ionotropic receptor 21a [Drosophila tropicalis]|uniref:ionotropic receptor 21a n=1 Tax=Drosophila tropicalis TaxID=46794 RepID=UPI0035AC1DB9
MWLLTLLLLLPQVELRADSQIIQLAELLNRIGYIYNLQAISIVHSLDSITQFELNELHGALRSNQSQHFYDLPQMTANEEPGGYFSALLDEDSLYVIFGRDTKDTVVQLQAQRARGRRYCKTLFLLKQVKSATLLRQFFQQLWLMQFRSALVLISGNSHRKHRVYRMDPYPELRVHRLKNVSHIENLFPIPNAKNFKGYKLLLPVQVDAPATFWYDHQLDGTGGKFIRVLMAHLNVTMELFPLIVNGSNYLNMPALIELIVSNRVELSPHLFTTLQPTTLVDYTYAYKVVPRCFMLPLDNQIPRSLYAFLPFEWPVWISLLSIMLFIHFVVIRRLQPDSQLWSLVGIPGSHSIPTARWPLWKFLHNYTTCLALIFGIFIISQLYSTKLTSFLTVILTRKPTNSLSEMFQLPYRILVLPSDVSPIVSSLGHAKEFQKHFKYASSSRFYTKRMEMDENTIYPISTIRWEFIDQQQRYLKYKKFHLSHLCYGTFPYQYQVRIDSHFKDPIHRIQLYIQQAGIALHWLKTTYRRAHQMGYVRDFAGGQHYKERPLNLNLLAPTFYLYLLGVSVSFIGFLFEIHTNDVAWFRR